MDLKAKSNIINQLLYDLRAEYLIACMLNEGLPQKDIMAVFDGILKRKWSTDVSHVEVESFENGDEALSIHLNRAGIYDSLPEALFHGFSDSRNINGEEMAKESMKLKNEEKQAKLFFMPLENEIFFRSVNVALKEDQQFNSLYSDFIDGLIPDFWKINQNIPKIYSSKLIRLLPFTHRIIGNYSLTAQCLEYIMGEKVSIELQNDRIEPDLMQNSNNNKSHKRGGLLGRSRLGSDMILGQTGTGFVGMLSAKIGPLKNTKPKDFFVNAPADLLLNCFFGYFISLELDVETKLLTEEKQRRFLLKDETGSEHENSYLGYNTFI